MNQINSASVHKRMTVVAATAVMVLSVLVGAASTPAALAAPKGIFAVFAQCPTSVPGLKLCEYDEITSGELAIGPLRVPIDKTIVFQAGALPTGGPNFNEYFLVPAIGSESVTPTELEVPGGLRSIIGCHPIGRGAENAAWAFGHDDCRGHSRDRTHGRVTGTIEPVANPSNPIIFNLAALVLEKGTALTFPARVHLKNPLLGEACYLGSESHPIELRLTDGTTNPPPPNQPISGKLGTVATEVEGEYEAVRITNGALVDNTFSVPIAEGCGHGHHTPIIDSLIDQTLGLESKAGHNTAILNITHKQAEVEAVLASEKFPTK